MAGLATRHNGVGGNGDEGLEWPLGDRDSRWPLFAQGSPGDQAKPNAWHVMILHDLSGPDGRCSGATDDEVFGVLGQWGSAGSWIEGRKLAVVRELIRRRPDERSTGTATESGLPWDWDDDRLAREIALELRVSVPAARKLAWSAWSLEARLPKIGKALEDGRLDPGRARMVIEETDVLSDAGQLAAAERLIIDGLPKCRTWMDLLRLVQRAVVTVDPDGARKRREQEEKENARVRFWREAAGTSALMGTGLPTDEALKAHAHVDQRAQQYRAAGIRRPIDILRVAAYLDLLNLVPPADRIARFRAEDAAATADAARPDPEKAHQPPNHTATGPKPDAPGPHNTTRPASGTAPPDPEKAHQPAPTPDAAARDGAARDAAARDGAARDGAEDSHADGNHGVGDPARGDQAAGSWAGVTQGDGAPGEPAPDEYPWDCPPDDGFPVAEDICGGCCVGNCPCRGWTPGEAPCVDCGHEACQCGGPAGDGRPADQHNPARGAGKDGGGPGGGPDEDPSPHTAEPAVAAEVNLTLRHLDIPFITAAGYGQQAGEARSLGVLDPAFARRLAEAAARHPDSKFCLTIVNSDGHAIGHGCCRPRTNRSLQGTSKSRQASKSRRSPEGRQFAGPPGKGQRDGPSPPATGAPGATTTFTLIPDENPGSPGGFGSWILTLPGQARELAVDLHPVPTGECDHSHESRRHDPGDLLRHLVNVRDGKCGFPACSRHARESDFEHAQPFDKGGRTCGCNCWSCSRSCHQVKQSEGWTVTEAKPGYHQWTTPSGRQYTQEPWRYPA